MRLTCREFAEAAGTRAVLPWVGSAGLSSTTAATRPATPPEGDGLTYGRWLTGERFGLFEHKGNCWHPQLVRSQKGDLLMSVIVGWRGWTMLVRSQDGGKTWLDHSATRASTWTRSRAISTSKGGRLGPGRAEERTPGDVLPGHQSLDPHAKLAASL